MQTFREVSRDEFFRVMNPLDVHPHLEGGYPYTAIWMTRSRSVIGKSVDYFIDGNTGAPATKWQLTA